MLSAGTSKVMSVNLPPGSSRLGGHRDSHPPLLRTVRFLSIHFVEVRTQAACAYLHWYSRWSFLSRNLIREVLLFPPCRIMQVSVGLLHTRSSSSSLTTIQCWERWTACDNSCTVTHGDMGKKTCRQCMLGILYIAPLPLCIVESRIHDHHPTCAWSVLKRVSTVTTGPKGARVGQFCSQLSFLFVVLSRLVLESGGNVKLGPHRWKWWANASRKKLSP